MITGIDDLTKVDASLPIVDAGTVEPESGPPAGRCDPAKPFGPAARMSDFALADHEDSDARLSPDERTVWFIRAPRDAGDRQVMTAKRADADARFDPPQLIELEVGAYFDPVMSADGLTLIVQHGGRAEDAKLRFTTRADPGARFLPLSYLAGVDAPDASERDPFMTDDGRLMFSRADDIYIATGDVTSGFAATALRGINTDKLERNPVLSRDGLRLYFSSDRETELGQRMFVATRPSVNEPFATATPLRELTVDGGTHDYDAPTWISPDDCVLYFASTREEDRLVHMYVARRPL